MKTFLVCFSLLVCFKSARGEAMLQLFNLSWSEVTAKMPEIAEAGYTSLWLPPPTKGASGGFSIGYDVFDPFDLGDKDQRGTVGTRYGTKRELIHLVERAHRFGLRVYFDNIMNHRAHEVPGFDANTSTNLYPGMVPGDFHLRVNSQGFFRNWADIGNFNNVWEVQNRPLLGLLDIAHESPNANFGPTEGSATSKPVLVRHPNNPEYYDLHPTLGRVGFGNVSGVTFTNNPSFYREDVNAYLLRALRWLFHETKCDGLRLDAVKHVPGYFFGQQTGANKDQSFDGYVGNAQLQFNLTHGFSDSNQRDSNFDAEIGRNDALVFGEHLGEPPGFGEYIDAGLRLLDNPLRNYLNNVLGNPGATLSGLEQRDAGGLSAPVRVMHAQSHDNDFASRRELHNAYYFFREGIPLIYSDGYNESPANGGEPFPRHARAPYLGQFGDRKMPDLAWLHHQLARGGTRPRWGDNDVVAFERFDSSQGGSAADQTVVFFAMNDNYGFPGDISFDDGLAQTTDGTFYECFPVENSRGEGLVVGFPAGSLLAQLADSPAKSRACAKLLVRLATNSRSEAEATRNDPNPANRKVYVGRQSLAPGGGAIELKIPSGGYVAYAYQWPEPSPASLGDVIQLEQRDVVVPRVTVARADGKDGDSEFNPIYPLRRRGSVDEDGNPIAGQNISNRTYEIDIPVITHDAPFDIIVRVDGSADNVLLKMDGGMDLNSQMGFAPTTAFDRRDHKPGAADDVFLGYEQAAFRGRRGPEKWGSTNVANNAVVSAKAETFVYTVGGGTSFVVGEGGGEDVDTETADWVYHDPARPVTTSGGPATQRVPLNPDANDEVEVWIKVGYQFQIDQVNLYYTIDGTEPLGAFGMGKAGTRVAAADFAGPDLADSNIDWWRASIPAAPGATVRYKVAAFDEGIAPISDASTDKRYGQTRFAATNFNPRDAIVWLHNNLNTNHTGHGLQEGYHIIRARAFLPRIGKSDVFNTFLQTFYYDAQPPQGAIALPPSDGAMLTNSSHEIVVRTDETAVDVEFNILDSDPGNDDANTGLARGNGLTNGVPVFARASRVSALPSLDQPFSALPQEFRFNYVGVPSNGSATITGHLKEITSATMSNRVRVLARSVRCAAPPLALSVAFPSHDGEEIALNASNSYTIVICLPDALPTDSNKFAITIDGSVQERTNANGSARYRFEGSFCGSGRRDLRYDWIGMSAGQHLIEVQFDSGSLNLHASRVVNVILSGVVDSDGDGLADAWERDNRFDPADASGMNGSAGDPDFDGFSNLEEFVAGTNPRDSNSLLRIMRLSNGGRQITWQSVPGRLYRVYSASDPNAAFDSISPTMTAFGFTASFTNGAPVQPREFYRVRVMP